MKIYKPKYDLLHYLAGQYRNRINLYAYSLKPGSLLPSAKRLINRQVR